MHVRTYVQASNHISIHSRKHRYMHAYIHTHTYRITYIHTYTYIQNYIHTHTYRITYIHTYINTYIHIHACMHSRPTPMLAGICVCIRMYTCMCRAHISSCRARTEEGLLSRERRVGLPGWKIKPKRLRATNLVE